jgi:pimeloyl-ACP methyl ester carboxylesterase
MTIGSVPTVTGNPYRRAHMAAPERTRRLPARLALLLIALVVAGCAPDVPSPPASPAAVPGSVAPGSSVAPRGSSAAGSSAGPGASAAPGGSPVASAAANAGPTLPPATKARWTDCGKGFQCATIKVPRDYDDALAGMLDLSLIRLPATNRDERIGSLVINPGGPGGSGVEFVRDGATEFPKAIRERFDLVGFDPRGVNSSSPVRCIDDLDGLATLDPSPDDAAELKALVDQAHDYADACAQRNAELLPYLSTAAVAQDLDRIRVAVGDDLLTYLGFSYGTLIGSMYADRFPDKIRAMVLDGALDPSLSEVQLRTGQAKAFEASLERFFSWCSHHRSCYFYEGGHTKAAFDKLMRAIDRKPIRILRYAGRRRVGPGIAFSAVLGAMYNRDAWPSLALALYMAKAGDGRYLVAISDPFRGRKPNGAYSNQSDAYFANTCLDFPVSTDVKTYQQLAATFAKVAPRFRAAAYNDLTCAFWPIAAERTPAPATGAGAPPIVVVGSTGDPATPYAWAKSLAKELESAVLVTRKGDGHTGYFFSACVKKAVNAYLIDGAVPKDGLVCPK